jgi:hypothetical protein
MGMAQLFATGRSHAVLNSLSLDFIASSFASLTEGGAFEEIGKRTIWALLRHTASTPTTTYCAIALDADMAHDPTWMHGVLSLLAARAGRQALTNLPLQSFDMHVQHEVAFRMLQSGLNTGKIVVRVGPRTMALHGTHIVTGGTSGLGLLTSRWLAQRGVCRLSLASRSGMLSPKGGADQEALQATGVEATAQRCDTSEMAHVRRLVALAPSLGGM